MHQMEGHLTVSNSTNYKQKLGSLRIVSSWQDQPAHSTNLSIFTTLNQPNQNAAGDFDMKDIRDTVKNKGVVIMGNFNYPHIDCLNMCSGQIREAKFLHIK